MNELGIFSKYKISEVRGVEKFRELNIPESSSINKISPDRLILLRRVVGEILSSEEHASKITFREGVLLEEGKLNELAEIIKNDFKTFGMAIETRVTPSSWENNPEILVFLQN